jgi:hypothetical protein
MGDDVKRWIVTRQDLWLIFVPWHFPLNDDPEISGASQKSENAFRIQFPSIYKHLLKFKKQLLDRNQAETGIRYEWYALQRYGASYWQEFSEPKLFYNETSKSLHSFYDKTGAYLNKTLFFLVSEDALFIQSLLMSNLFDFKYRRELAAHGDALQGGRPQFKKSAMEKLPIPTATPEDKARLTTLAVACAEATRKQDAAALATLESEINRLVYRLFALTPAEIALIASSIAT